MPQGVFVGCTVPALWLLVRAARDDLGANPVNEVLNQFGLAALILLIASLACTPLKMLAGWKGAVPLRKTLGLFAFFYAALHFFTYAVIDLRLDLATIFEDVTARWFIAVGFAAFVLLVPLAITSTARAVRRMGFRRWKSLHRLAYVAAALAAVHFFLREKSDVTEPLVYAAVLGVLLVSRAIKRR